MNIEIETLSRTWRTWGDCLIGFAHGDMQKKRLGQWLHQEAREEYGKSKWAEMHVGHIHHQVTQEENGIILRHLPTITPDDKWHYDKGFVGSVRGTICFVWDKKAGLREQWYTIVN